MQIGEKGRRKVGERSWPGRRQVGDRSGPGSGPGSGLDAAKLLTGKWIAERTKSFPEQIPMRRAANLLNLRNLLNLLKTQEVGRGSTHLRALTLSSPKGIQNPATKKLHTVPRATWSPIGRTECGSEAGRLAGDTGLRTSGSGAWVCNTARSVGYGDS